VTTTVTEAIARGIAALRYDTLSQTAGLAAIGALVVLLLIKEVRRLRQGEEATESLALVDVFLVPLVLTFGIIVTARLAELL
jgi:hypothetical protein